MKKMMLVVMMMMVTMVMGFTTKAKAITPKEEMYAQVTVVVNVDRQKDIVTCVDFNGYAWEFDGCEDWDCGDYCTMVMSDNGTKDTVFDDKIVSYRYDGWLDGSFGFDGENTVVEYWH